MSDKCRSVEGYCLTHERYLVECANYSRVPSSTGTTLSSEAVAGRWYESAKYGRVLCCGSTDPEFWVNSFAVRVGGRTVLKFFSHDELVESPVQSW